MALLDKLKAVAKVIREPQETPDNPQPQANLFPCKRCGELLQAEERYCPRCGTPTRQDFSSEPFSPPPTPSFEAPKVAEPLRKCPSCGEALKGSEKECPACGFLLQNEKGTNAVAELSQQLSLARTELQRITLIKTFPIPNNEEDIFEFMILASSNFDANYHAVHANEEDVSDAWLSKIEQCYQKAKHICKNNAILNNIDKSYKDVKKRIKKADAESITEKSTWKAILINRQKQKRRERKIAMIVLSVMLVIMFSALGICAILGVFEEEDPYKNDPSAIKVGYSDDDLKGQHYQDVIELLEAKGFTNIEAREDGWNLFKDDGAVKKITIDGKDNFSSSSKFPPSVKIIIFYYE